jgi:hypothetical protein
MYNLHIQKPAASERADRWHVSFTFWGSRAEALRLHAELNEVIKEQGLDREAQEGPEVPQS